MNNQRSVEGGSNLDDLLEAKNLRTRAVVALERCLEATHSFYDIITGKVITFPDYITRLAAVIIVLAYTDGKPVERREMVTRPAPTLEELREQAKASPALREAIAELLDENQ
jgi:hypothetical protein